RLMPARHIDNAEPPHTDACCAIRIKAFVVGPAMRDHAAHFAQSRRACPRVACEFKNPSDPAHLAFLRVWWRTMMRRIMIPAREWGTRAAGQLFARQLFEQSRNGKLARHCAHHCIPPAPLDK